MKKILTIIAAITVLFTKPKQVLAGGYVVSSSARLFRITEKSRIDYRAIKLRRFLESHNSPLKPHSKDFVKYADKYNLDWRLVPAIAGVESTFGKRIPYNSYNAYGWANGDYYFNSWKESIYIVSKTLRQKYYNRGANSINKVAGIYAPPSNSWGWKVKYFMNQIEDMPLEFDL